MDYLFELKTIMKAYIIDNPEGYRNLTLNDMKNS